MPWERIKRLKTLHRVRLILCVGGWERSNGFSKVAAWQSVPKDAFKAVDWMQVMAYDQY